VCLRRYVCGDVALNTGAADPAFRNSPAAASAAAARAHGAAFADGHGTHCSGIIGAIDNAEGVLGALGQGARIHAHAALDSNGNGPDSAVGAARLTRS
jgi:subtilisin family serine protease